LAVEPKIVFAKVNKAADTKEYTKFAAELWFRSIGQILLPQEHFLYYRSIWHVNKTSKYILYIWDNTGYIPWWIWPPSYNYRSRSSLPEAVRGEGAAYLEPGKVKVRANWMEQRSTDTSYLEPGKIKVLAKLDAAEVKRLPTWSQERSCSPPGTRCCRRLTPLISTRLQYQNCKAAPINE
jgi:hypothetical protein